MDNAEGVELPWEQWKQHDDPCTAARQLNMAGGYFPYNDLPQPIV